MGPDPLTWIIQSAAAYGWPCSDAGERKSVCVCVCPALLIRPAALGTIETQITSTFTPREGEGGRVGEGETEREKERERQGI